MVQPRMRRTGTGKLSPRDDPISSTARTSPSMRFGELRALERHAGACGLNIARPPCPRRFFRADASGSIGTLAYFYRLVNISLKYSPSDKIAGSRGRAHTNRRFVRAAG